MTRWTGSTDPEDATGIATFAVGDTVAAIPLDSFETARQVESLIDQARREGAATARQAAARYLRGAALQMEGNAS